MNFRYASASRDATRPDSAGTGAVASRPPVVPVSGAMDRTPVIAVLENGVLTLMLNRPKRLNAMSNGLIEAMNAELARARADDDIRAVLLTGVGRGFCASADLAGGGTVDAKAATPCHPALSQVSIEKEETMSRASTHVVRLTALATEHMAVMPGSPSLP